MTGFFLCVLSKGVGAMESCISLLANYLTIASAFSASRSNLLMSWWNSNEKHFRTFLSPIITSAPRRSKVRFASAYFFQNKSFARCLRNVPRGKKTIEYYQWSSDINCYAYAVDLSKRKDPGEACGYKFSYNFSNKIQIGSVCMCKRILSIVTALLILIPLTALNCLALENKSGR